MKRERFLTILFDNLVAYIVGIIFALTAIFKSIGSGDLFLTGIFFIGFLFINFLTINTIIKLKNYYKDSKEN